VTTPYVDPQTIHNPATGTSPPASWGDSVRDGLEFCAKRPGVVLDRSASQSIANNSNVAIAFGTGTTLRDSDAWHSESTNNTRVTIGTGFSGWYRCDAFVRFATNGTGHRDVFVRVNGSTTVAHSVAKVAPITAQDAFASTSCLVQLVAGDYVELVVLQTSGGALNATRATFAVVLEMVA
jgi:hypothetical protein